MRIYQAIHSATNPSAPDSQTWLRNLYSPLIDLGHEVTLFPTDEGRIAMKKGDKKLKSKFSERLLGNFLHNHQRKPYDMFFSYLMDGMVYPEVIQEISKRGVPTLNFSCNNVHQFDLVDGISPYFDFNLHAEKAVKEKFKAVGANPIWWPMAANPKFFKPFQVPKTIDVAFVGANYALRQNYIAYLLTNGIDVHAYGPNWQISGVLKETLKRLRLGIKTLFASPRRIQSRLSSKLAFDDFHRWIVSQFPENFHGPLTDQDMIMLYSKSEISLGFLEVFEDHNQNKALKKHLHLREFEAPMCGALLCTGYMEEIELFYKPGIEILVYNSFDELVDKVRFYLEHQDQAVKIRAAGRERALRDHTYHRRYKLLFKELGFRGK